MHWQRVTLRQEVPQERTIVRDQRGRRVISISPEPLALALTINEAD